MGRVQDKVCLVTGGAAGMGREHVLLLAEEGARIVLTDLNEEAGKATADEVKGMGGEAIFVIICHKSEHLKVATSSSAAPGAAVPRMIRAAPLTDRYILRQSHRAQSDRL